jgi:hypothetical protein
MTFFCKRQGPERLYENTCRQATLCALSALWRFGISCWDHIDWSVTFSMKKYGGLK